ncbi:hypothetical protein B0H19DRAFT_1096196 [Mycena capillaripes]|nr:hypothetical protein B0H19DRAFT_1096196 [Mycena capillaripes]
MADNGHDHDYDYQHMNDADMIEEVIRKAPNAARKFLVSTPALEKDRSEKRQAKRPTSQKPSGSRGQPRKKRKTDDDNNDEIEIVDDDDDEPPVTIAVYIWIPKTLPSLPTKFRKAKTKTDDEYLKKGPFTILPNDKYPQFLAKLAAALPCLLEHIHEQKMMWKPIKPGNASFLPLGGLDGYKVMVASAADRKPAERIVVLQMPAPAQPMEEEMPWVTAAATDEKPPRFDYTELEPSGLSDSILQQQQSFNKATKDERAILEDTYRIGNYPHIDPNKRIYHDAESGFYFELNDSRMGVWCSAMAQKKTDKHKPPLDSRFFDANQRIKNIGNAPAAPAPAVNAPPAVPPATFTPSLSMSDIFMASLLSQSGGAGFAALFPHLNPAAPTPAPAPAPSVDSPQPGTAPPSPVKRHHVTVERFCEVYDIDAVDCAQLQEVGFRPGDLTEPKPDDDLKEAGFSIFGWKRIHAANVRFKGDLGTGKFDD